MTVRCVPKGMESLVIGIHFISLGPFNTMTARRTSGHRPDSSVSVVWAHVYAICTVLLIH